jgi:hypothetical protein
MCKAIPSRGIQKARLATPSGSQFYESSSSQMTKLEVTGPPSWRVTSARPVMRMSIAESLREFKPVISFRSRTFRAHGRWLLCNALFIPRGSYQTTGLAGREKGRSTCRCTREAAAAERQPASRFCWPGRERAQPSSWARAPPRFQREKCP